MNLGGSLTRQVTLLDETVMNVLDKPTVSQKRSHRVLVYIFISKYKCTIYYVSGIVEHIEDVEHMRRVRGFLRNDVMTAVLKV